MEYNKQSSGESGRNKEEAPHRFVSCFVIAVAELLSVMLVFKTLEKASELGKLGCNTWGELELYNEPLIS
jgi:hypothetical protein